MVLLEHYLNLSGIQSRSPHAIRLAQASQPAPPCQPFLAGENEFQDGSPLERQGGLLHGKQQTLMQDIQSFGYRPAMRLALESQTRLGVRPEDLQQAQCPAGLHRSQDSMVDFGRAHVGAVRVGHQFGKQAFGAVRPGQGIVWADFGKSLCW